MLNIKNYFLLVLALFALQIQSADKMRQINIRASRTVSSEKQNAQFMRHMAAKRSKFEQRFKSTDMPAISGTLPVLYRCITQQANLTQAKQSKNAGGNIHTPSSWRKHSLIGSCAQALPCVLLLACMVSEVCGHERDQTLLNPCDEYLKIEEITQCGPQGYPLGFGKRYCEKFTELKSANPDMAGWIDHTMYGLQQAIGPYIGKASCDELHEIAFDQHPDVYANNGFCDLGISNWLKVVGVLDVEDLFGHWRSLKQLGNAAIKCGKQLSGHQINKIGSAFGIADPANDPLVRMPLGNPFIESPDTTTQKLEADRTEDQTTKSTRSETAQNHNKETLRSAAEKKGYESYSVGSRAHHTTSISDSSMGGRNAQFSHTVTPPSSFDARKSIDDIYRAGIQRPTAEQLIHSDIQQINERNKPGYSGNQPHRASQEPESTNMRIYSGNGYMGISHTGKVGSLNYQANVHIAGPGHASSHPGMLEQKPQARTVYSCSGNDCPALVKIVGDVIEFFFSPILPGKGCPYGKYEFPDKEYWRNANDLLMAYYNWYACYYQKANSITRAFRTDPDKLLEHIRFRIKQANEKGLVGCARDVYIYREFARSYGFGHGPSKTEEMWNPEEYELKCLEVAARDALEMIKEKLDHKLRKKGLTCSEEMEKEFIKVAKDAIHMIYIKRLAKVISTDELLEAIEGLIEQTHKVQVVLRENQIADDDYRDLVQLEQSLKKWHRAI